MRANGQHNAFSPHGRSICDGTGKGPMPTCIEWPKNTVGVGIRSIGTD